MLYLHVGEPQAASDGEETPEGHALRFDADGNVIGLTIINARWLLERDGEILVTLPEQVHVASATLEPLMAVV